MSVSEQLEQDFSFFIHQSRSYQTENFAANLERTCSICLNLLTQLPSAREAIFDYFNSLINIEVHCFIKKDSVVANVTNLLSNIESKLIALATESNSWANILAQWSIDRLFDIVQSQQNAAPVKTCENLDERLQFWNGCQSAVALIKIASACILHDSKAADTALTKYIESSIGSQTPFDWITVSLSLRCGKILICRLIQLSFIEIDQAQTIAGLKRVIGVCSSLGVIAEQIPQLFSQTLIEHIQNLLASNDPQKQASLILLARMIFVINDQLCDLIYYSLYRSINSTNVRRLCSSIRQTKSSEATEQLTKEFVSGLIRIQTDAFEIIQFLLSFIQDEQIVGDGSKAPDEIDLILHESCQIVLQQLCQECHCKFRLWKDNQKPRISILASLRNDFEQLLLRLNYTENPRKHHLINDLCFNVALYNGGDIKLKYLENSFTNRMPIDILHDIYLEFDYYHPNSLYDALNFIFERNESEKIEICLENLLQLVLLEDVNDANSRSIQSVIWSLIDHLSRLLSENSPHFNLILQIILQLTRYQHQPTYEQILRLANSLTDIHMKIVEDDENDFLENLLLWRDALFNVIHFNNHDFHLSTLITLVDFLIPRINPLDRIDDSTNNNRSTEKSNSLLEQNRNVDTRNLNRLLPRSFKRNVNTDRFIRVPTQCLNEYTMLMTQVFNELLFKDFGYSDNQQKQQLWNSLATTVIDNILPDATIETQFDDDQCKTPNERNLALIRRLDEHPMIWILLELIAGDSNAFQLCLPIVRSVLSALIIQWENFRGEDRAKNYPKQLNLSTNLIILLKKARYLPIPLNEVHELFPLVTTYDCFTLLSNVWNYLKQNQQLFISKQLPLLTIVREGIYLDPIRFVIQKNIADVGIIAEHFLPLQNNLNLS